MPNCSNGMKILKNLSKVEREVVSTGNVLTDREIKNYVKELCLD